MPTDDTRDATATPTDDDDDDELARLCPDFDQARFRDWDDDEDLPPYEGLVG